MTSLLVGPKAPEALRVTLRAGNSGVSMLDVVSCSLSVRKPDGSVETWATTLSGASLASCVATHIFDAGGIEAALAGSYVVSPTVMVGAVERRCAPFKLHFVPYPTP